MQTKDWKSIKKEWLSKARWSEKDGKPVLNFGKLEIKTTIFIKTWKSDWIRKLLVWGSLLFPILKQIWKEKVQFGLVPVPVIKMKNVAYKGTGFGYGLWSRYRVSRVFQLRWLCFFPFFFADFISYSSTSIKRSFSVAYWFEVCKSFSEKDGFLGVTCCLGSS